jgi:ankyrin repeat protein
VNENDCFVDFKSGDICYYKRKSPMDYFRATNFNECLLVANDPNIVKLLLKSGATNVNEALLKACSNQNKEVVQLLINSGANNLNDALLCAIEVKSIDIVRLLLEKGADDYTAILNFANENGHKFLADLMTMKLVTK